MRRADCTEKITGLVADIYVKSNDITLMTVAYLVDGEEYEIQEVLKFKGRAIKIGWLPIGQIRYPVVGDKRIGDEIEICYNPNNPAEAFIESNKGFWTS